MRKVTLLALAALFGLPGLAAAQWNTTAPSITASATVASMRQFNTTNSQSLNFGNVTPGVAVTVAHTTTGATATDPNSAKVNIRFNVGTRVEVTPPAALTHTNGTNQIIPTSFACYVDTSNTGSTATAFSTPCGVNVKGSHEWLNAAVTGMTERWVLIGGSLDGPSTANALYGTYTGTITIALVPSAS